MSAPAFKNVFGMAKAQVQEGIYNLAGEGAPVSGNSLASGYLVAGKGSTYQDTVTGIVYENQGDATNLYWTPVNILDNNLLGWTSAFRDGVGKAISDTAATVTLVGSGLRIFGLGITETDSGLAIAIAEDGPIGTLTATNEDDKLAAIGVGVTTSVVFQPNTHGPISVEALIAASSALTLRRIFIGFVGTAADALAPPVDGVTTTITLVQDDLAGILMDAGLTNADGLFGPHNKSDEAASIATTACDLATDMPAAGTYVKLRVTIDAAGEMQCFVNGVLKLTVAAALDVDEEVTPVLLVGSLEANTKAILVKYFSSWGNRLNS